MSYLYKEMQNEDYAILNSKLKSRDSIDILRFAHETYGKNLVYACSFGAEAMVMLDLLSKVQKDAQILFLDTDFHFKETYDLIEKVKQRYPHMKIKLAKSSLTPEEQENQFGAKLG
ncbi:phosphoadenylyl-sulfate reductase [Bacillus sp. JCM 19047]|nr:phosphoadenylyl-sulfate reductase [Bacillus sp. JCM 19047]